MRLPIAAQNPSTVRSAAFRTNALSLEKAFSEVGAVGRQVVQFCTRSLDHLSHAWPFMAGQVVHEEINYRIDDYCVMAFTGPGMKIQ